MRSNLACLILSGAILPASPAGAASDRDGFDLMAFEASQVAVVQSDESFAASGQLGWSPTFFFTSWLGLGIDVEAAILKAAPVTEDSSSKYYAATNAEVFAILALGPLSIGLGGGVARWHDEPASQATILSTKTSWETDDLFGAIDRLIAGYTSLRFEDSNAYEIQLGMGFSF